MRAVLPLVLALPVAACGYRPGSFNHARQGFVGQRTTIGCLDLAIERRADLSTGGAVLAYEFGNRCDRPALVDLANVRVLAQTASGERISLAAYDPNWEIQPLRIDGRTVGREAIAYPKDGQQLVQVCIDAGSLAHASEARWMCFSSSPYALAEAGER